LFYGENCDKTRILALVWTVGLFTFSVFELVWAYRLFATKWLCSEKKWSACTSTAFSVLISSIGSVSCHTAGLFRSLNKGYQRLLEQYVQPIAFTFFTEFVIITLLHVTFLWMELATSVRLSSERTLVRSKNLLIVLGCVYFGSAIAIFFWTASYAGVAVLCLIYDILILFAFVRGSFMISRKLQSTNIVATKTPFRNSQTQTPLVCAHKTIKPQTSGEKEKKEKFSKPDIANKNQAQFHKPKNSPFKSK